MTEVCLTNEMETRRECLSRKVEDKNKNISAPRVAFNIQSVTPTKSLEKDYDTSRELNTSSHKTSKQPAPVTA